MPLDRFNNETERRQSAGRVKSWCGSLQQACALLENARAATSVAPPAQLPQWRDALALTAAECDRIENAKMRVAVVGPTSAGKSTLLRALLSTNAQVKDFIPAGMVGRTTAIATELVLLPGGANWEAWYRLGGSDELKAVVKAIAERAKDYSKAQNAATSMLEQGLLLDRSALKGLQTAIKELPADFGTAEAMNFIDSVAQFHSNGVEWKNLSDAVGSTLSNRLPELLKFLATEAEDSLPGNLAPQIASKEVRRILWAVRVNVPAGVNVFPGLDAANGQISLIDLPGLGAIQQKDWEVTRSMLKTCDGVVFASAANQPLLSVVQQVRKHIFDSMEGGNPNHRVMRVVTQIDSLNPSEGEGNRKHLGELYTIFRGEAASVPEELYHIVAAGSAPGIGDKARVVAGELRNWPEPNSHKTAAERVFPTADGGVDVLRKAVAEFMGFLLPRARWQEARDRVGACAKSMEAAVDESLADLGAILAQQAAKRALPALFRTLRSELLTVSTPQNFPRITRLAGSDAIVKQLNEELMDGLACVDHTLSNAAATIWGDVKRLVFAKMKQSTEELTHAVDRVGLECVLGRLKPDQKLARTMNTQLPAQGTGAKRRSGLDVLVQELSKYENQQQEWVRKAMSCAQNHLNLLPAPSVLLKDPLDMGEIIAALIQAPGSKTAGLSECIWRQCQLVAERSIADKVDERLRRVSSLLRINVFGVKPEDGPAPDKALLELADAVSGDIGGGPDYTRSMKELEEAKKLIRTVLNAY